MIRSATVAVVLAAAIILSLRDLLVEPGNQRSGQAAGEERQDVDDFATFKDSVPKPRMTSKMSGPTMKFLFCYSCGYRRAFEEFSRIVHERYPTLTIEGDNYPPPQYKAILAQVLSVVKLGFIAAVLFGFDPFSTLGVQTPGVFQWALQNKIYACIMTFFLSNAIEGQLTSTGAFEIILNDVPVWSKLESGRIPSPQELLQVIESHMKFSGGGAPHTV